MSCFALPQNIGRLCSEDNPCFYDVYVYVLATIEQWMDKLASLRAFVKVVESGSFAEAGRQLRLSRSAISKHIGELEQSLGVQLVARTTRHASPTENGQLYYERALSILSDIDAAD